MDDNLELVERYEVVNYPSFAWTDATGKLISRTVQPADSAELLEELEDVLADMGETAPTDE